jgi:hypothetical protein
MEDNIKKIQPAEMLALEKEIQINKGHTNLLYYNKDRS